MSDWIGELQSALAAEFGDKPHVATLATVDKTGSPRARSVVCRRLSADGAVYVASDARSEKNDQLKANPQAEVVFWLAAARAQFRLGGTAKVVGPAAQDPARREVWRAMSDAARALFAWPTPGARRIDPPEAFIKAVGPEVEPPPHFELIVLRPRRVEHLSLGDHPHRRRRWMLAGKWSAAAEVNP